MGLYVPHCDKNEQQKTKLEVDKRGLMALDETIHLLCVDALLNDIELSREVNEQLLNKNRKKQFRDVKLS